MIKFSLVCNRKKQLKKDGTALIQIRAYQDAQYRYFSTGVAVDPEHWSEEAQKIVRHPEANKANAILYEQLNKLELFVAGLSKNGKEISLKDIDLLWKLDVDKPNSFIGFYEQHLEEHKLILKNQTIRHHRVTLGYLKEFMGSKDLSFDELTYEFVKNFDLFLRRERKLAINTLHGHHKHIKRYLMDAIKLGLFDEKKNPYQTFSVKREKTNRTVLTLKEVEAMERLEFKADEQHLRRIRDMFLFGCYTGLRHSDLSRIRAENIRKTEEGLELTFVAYKTNKQLTLPLYKLYKGKPEKIVLDYLQEQRETDKPLFERSAVNQYVNRMLKIIGNRSGLLQQITMHVARHTFATHMAGHIPTHILQRILQHSKIETTMVYVHLNDAMMREALDKVKW